MKTRGDGWPTSLPPAAPESTTEAPLSPSQWPSEPAQDLQEACSCYQSRYQDLRTACRENDVQCLMQDYFISGYSRGRVFGCGDTLTEARHMLNMSTNTSHASSALYYVHNKTFSITLLVLGMQMEDQTALAQTNDFFHVAWMRENIKWVMYREISRLYRFLQVSIYVGSLHHIRKRVIPLVTSFSRGTVHGYTGLWHILMQYVNSGAALRDYWLLVFRKSQGGILQIIEHACTIKLMDREKLLYIDPGKVYRFDEMQMLWFYNHDLFRLLIKDPKACLRVSDFIHFHFVDVITGNRSQPASMESDVVAVLKYQKSGSSLSKPGTLPEDVADRLVRLHNATLLEPEQMGEISLIRTIASCKALIVTWGTSFMKNFVYASDKCEQIVVYVYGDDDFRNQYNMYLEAKTLPRRFRNAAIEYRLDLH
jgi:hypothetical protein